MRKLLCFASVAIVFLSGFLSELVEGAEDTFLRGVTNIQHIELNPDSELYPDIESIVHSPKHKLLRVVLKENARCSNPYLRGRLSGKALAMIKWKKEGQRTFYGQYKIPFEGDFFLEIVTVFCNYVPDDMDRCLVPGESFRVTADNVEIKVTKASEVRGYWESPEHVPLYTRWQPQNCRSTEDKLSRRCHSVGTVVPFDNYNFKTYSKIADKWSKIDTSSRKSGTWRKIFIRPLADAEPDFNKCLKPKDKSKDTPICDLCLWGASHSYRLKRFLQIFVGVRVGSYSKTVPQNLKSKHISLFKKRCKTLLVGFGQHSLANGASTTEYTENMRVLLKALEDHPNVVGRSVHYNPEGDEKLKCPTTDNRNVAYVDDYNDAMKKLYAEMGREWIDTRWIDGAMWDSNFDWNHLHHKVELAETWFLADHLGLLDGDHVLEPEFNLEHIVYQSLSLF